MSKRIIKITKEFAEKSKLDISEYIGKSIKRIETYSDDVESNDSEHYVMGRMSFIAPDADGDVLLPQAFDLNRYQKNPIILKNHNYDNPVGYCESISVQGSQILGKIKFGSTQTCQDVYQLYKDKVLRGFSVGFIPLQEVQKGTTQFNQLMEVLIKEYPNIFTKEAVNRVDRILTKAELVEISCVAVPNNKEATAIEVKSLENKEEKIAVVDEKNIETPVIIKKIGNISPIKIKKLGNVYDEKINDAYLKLGGF
jgi:phage head maturation protease